MYRRETASILNLVVKPSHSDKRPANALIAKAVEICHEKGISFITYGMLHYGNKRSGTLLEFKIRNGFEEILVPRYFVPLTTWGAICVKAKLYRGILGILPSGAITLGVRLRTKWYNFSTRQGRCSSMTERPNRTRQTERSNPPAGSSSNSSQPTYSSLGNP